MKNSKTGACPPVLLWYAEIPHTRGVHFYGSPPRSSKSDQRFQIGSDTRILYYSTACGNNILLSLPIRVGTVTASSTNAEGAEENWPPLVCGISAYHKRSVGEEDFSYISYLLFSISYGDYLNTTPVVKHFDYASF